MRRTILVILILLGLVSNALVAQWYRINRAHFIRPSKIIVLDSLTLFIAGEKLDDDATAALMSTDGGYTWREVWRNGTWSRHLQLSMMEGPGATVWIGQGPSIDILDDKSGMLIRRIDDIGHDQYPCFVREITEIATAKDTRVFAVVCGGTMVSDDTGRTWSYYEQIDDEFRLDHLDFFDKDRGIALGGNQGFLYTTDGARTWRRPELPFETGEIRDIAVLSDSHAVSVGDMLLYSTNSGKSWSYSTTRVPTGRCTTVVAVGDRHLWAVGSGVIMHSKTAGLTWYPQYYVRFTDGQNFDDVGAADTNVAHIAAEIDHYRSVNSGDSGLVTTHVEETLVANDGLTLSPFPASSYCRVVSDHGILECELTNTLGSLVYTKTGSTTDRELLLDVSTLPAGLYWLTTRLTTGRRGLPLLIQR